MKPSQLIKYAEFCIQNNLNLLIVGAAGGGKSDITTQATHNTGRKLIITHPVVSDPTDYKGLPYATEKGAEFLPFGELRKLIEAQEPTVLDIEDLGQAAVSVQAALMQILLAREINGHKISDKVSIVATSNRKQDKAGVTGLLEPVKSRFRGGIVELEVDSKDWLQWALSEGNMPLSLIAFIRFKPDIIDNPKSIFGEDYTTTSKDLVNTVSPRTLASVGMAQNAGLPQEFEHEAFKGIAGEAFAAEYTSFIKLMRQLPTLDEIILNPKGANIPKGAGNMYALCAGLANRMTDMNIGSILTYLYRIPAEFRVLCMKDATIRHGVNVTNTKAYIDWSIKEGQLLNI